jgi:Bicoid-interacting protein 3 (Bin3)
LIRAAWRRRRVVWSLREPCENSHNAQENGESRGDITGGANYFPASLEHSFGPLPIPPCQTRDSHLFPHNVTFRTADWVNGEIPEDADGYDTVIALGTIFFCSLFWTFIIFSFRSFSVSKWIHLNGGDDAIRLFFRRVHTVLSRGGTFVLEPQPWDGYAKAKRMSEVCCFYAYALNSHRSICCRD